MVISTKVKVWLLASRPKTLWASIAPVIIGTAMAYADGSVHWLSAVMAAFGAVMIQVGTNYTNDYFDYKHGADNAMRLGPMRVVQTGLAKPNEIKTAIVLAFSVAIMAGIYLFWRGGMPILIIGLFSVLFGILYTAGPFPLGYYGLGDILVFLFFGLVAVGGTYYVQTLRINMLVLLAGVPPGLLSTAILSVNNLRDMNTDRDAGKKTLAVRFGLTFVRMEYLFCIIVAGLMPLFLPLIGSQHYYGICAVFIIPCAMPSIKLVFANKQGRIFNKILADTGKLLFLYSVLFSVGWIL